jgi:hypothetical protein
MYDLRSVEPDEVGERRKTRTEGECGKALPEGRHGLMEIRATDGCQDAPAAKFSRPVYAQPPPISAVPSPRPSICSTKPSPMQI